MKQQYTNLTRNPTIEILNYYIKEEKITDREIKRSICPEQEILKINKNYILFVQMEVSKDYPLKELFYYITTQKVKKEIKLRIWETRLSSLAKPLTEQVIEEAGKIRERHLNLKEEVVIPAKEERKNHIIEITQHISIIKDSIYQFYIEIVDDDEENEFEIIHNHYLLNKEIVGQAMINVEGKGLEPEIGFETISKPHIGTSFIHMRTRNLIHHFQEMSTNDKRVPIEFSIIFNKVINSNVNYVGKNMRPSFYYQITKYDQVVIIEDASGAKYYYQKMTLSSIKKEEYGIKKVEENETIVYYELYTKNYLYYKKNNEIVHYDQQENKILFQNSNFKINGENRMITRIQKLTSKSGSFIEYKWSNQYLEKISNSSGDYVYINYDSGKKQIETIDYSTLQEVMSLTYDATSTLIGIKIEKYNGSSKSSSTNVTIVQNIEILYQFDRIKEIKNLKSNDYIQYTYELEQVKEVKEKELSTQKQYIYQYDYYKEFFTKKIFENIIEVSEGQESSLILYYELDDYDRIISIYDNEGYFQTWNYDEIEDGKISKKEQPYYTAYIAKQTNYLKNWNFHQFNEKEKWIIPPDKAKDISSEKYINEDFQLQRFKSDLMISQNFKFYRSGTYQIKMMIGKSDNFKVRLESDLYTKELSFSRISELAQWDKIISEEVFIDEEMAKKEFQIKVLCPQNGVLKYVILNRKEDAKIENLVKNGFFVDFDDKAKAIDWQCSENAKLEDGNCGYLGNYIAMINKDFQRNWIKQEIQEKGSPHQKYTLIIDSSSKIYKHESLKVSITFHHLDNGEETYHFDIGKRDSGGFFSRTISSQKAFHKITIQIESLTKNTICISGVILKKEVGSGYYQYNRFGNISQINDGNDIKCQIIYDNKQRIYTTETGNGELFYYEYDEKDRLNKIIDQYQNEVEYTYNEKDEIIQKTIRIEDESFSLIYQYDQRGNLIQVKDIYGRIRQQSYDGKGNLLTHKENAITYEYFYDEEDRLKRFFTQYQNKNYENSLDYSSTQKLIKMSNNYGLAYHFEYSQGRISKEKQNQLILNEYTHEFEGKEKEQLYTNLHQYGASPNKEKRIYNYKNQLINSFINDEKLQYDYDEQGRLIAIYEEKTKLNQPYNQKMMDLQYDENGNVSQFILNDYTYLNGNVIFNDYLKTQYEHDNLNQVQQKNVLSNEKEYQLNYDYEDEGNEYVNLGFFKQLEKISDDEFIYPNKEGKGVYGASPTQKQFEIVKNDYPTQLDAFSFPNNSSILTYSISSINQYRAYSTITKEKWNKEQYKKDLEKCFMFYAFVKFEGLKTELPLFTLKDKNNDIIGKIVLSSQDKLIYKNSSNGVEIELSSSIGRGNWNFIAFKLYKNNGIFKRIALVQNDEYIEKATELESNQVVSLVINQHIYLQPSLLKGSFKIAFMSIGAKDYNQYQLKNIYLDSQKHIFNKAKELKNTTTFYSKLAPTSEFISLKGSLMSNHGLKPIYLNQKNKKMIFKYDPGEKSPVYASFHNLNHPLTNSKPIIAYPLNNLSTEGLIQCDFKLEGNLNQTRTIFEIYKKDVPILSVYTRIPSKAIGEYGFSENPKTTLYIRFFSEEVSHDYLFPTPVLEVEENKWHTLKLMIKNGSISIYYNDKYIFNISASLNLEDSIIYLGNSLMALEEALNGYLKNIYIDKNSSSNYSVAPTFKKITTKDLLGRKKKIQFITKNKTLTSTFIYDKTRVIKEILPDNTIVDYTYLDSGLLSKKTFTKNDEIYESCTYSYDSFHRLIREIHNKSMTTYQYDEFGNISKTNYQDKDNPNVDLVRSYNTYTRLSNIKNTTFSSLKKNTLFEYSTTMPDKMTGVYDKYNQEEEHSYEWDNNRLIKVDDLTFTYNRDGYRIAKKKGTDTTTYKLEGSKVVQLNKNRLVIDFIYDEDDKLFAMEYGNQIYYYIKDQTGNIVKIIDETGNTMVEYSYNGWGEVKVIYGSQTSVAALNPFLYKSYLYDVETNLYYIGKRYYDPTLGKFIHYDTNLSLTPCHPNGLNLYIYANNNPISIAYSNSSVGVSSSGRMVSSLSLGGLSNIVNSFSYSNSFNIFAGLNWPQFNGRDLSKDIFISLGETWSRIAWGLTKNGCTFLDFHYSAYGINGYTALDNLPSTSAKIFKGIGIALMINDIFEAGYYSYQNGHSFGQGVLNVGLTAGENILVYKAST